MSKRVGETGFVYRPPVLHINGPDMPPMGTVDAWILLIVECFERMNGRWCNFRVSGIVFQAEFALSVHLCWGKVGTESRNTKKGYILQSVWRSWATWRTCARLVRTRSLADTWPNWAPPVPSSRHASTSSPSEEYGSSRRPSPLITVAICL